MIKVELIVVQGKPEGKAIPILGSVFRIGRDPTCQLRPSSDQVSRLHSEVILTPDDKVIVKDMGSRNGTLVNGKVIAGPTALKSGDLVKVGPLTFAVAIQGGKEAQTAGPTPLGTKPGALDEVPQEQVDAWLIADQQRPVPDRPSGVYDGQTITIEAYKGGSAKSPAAKPSGEAEKPHASAGAGQEPAKPPGSATPPAPSEPAPKTPPKTAKPVPTPAPPAAAASVKPPSAAAISTQQASPPPPSGGGEPRHAPAAPKTPAPEPAVPSAAPPPTDETDFFNEVEEDDTASTTKGGPKRRSFLEEVESLELTFLAEGEGEGDSESTPRTAETTIESEGGEEEEAEGDKKEVEDLAEEFVDESNPFYAAKKKGGGEQQKAEPTKPSYKDSSDAASDILKKMLDRRRNK